MPASGTITLYHSPNTRSSSTLLLLEELGAPYELKLLNLKAGEQRQQPYLAINPMGKVPAIEHNGAIVTEQVAIAIYLSDLFPDSGPRSRARRSVARTLFALAGLLRRLLRACYRRPRRAA